jgi:hypothetical protein
MASWMTSDGVDAHVDEVDGMPARQGIDRVGDVGVGGELARREDARGEQVNTRRDTAVIALPDRTRADRPGDMGAMSLNVVGRTGAVILDAIDEAADAMGMPQATMRPKPGVDDADPHARAERWIESIDTGRGMPPAQRAIGWEWDAVDRSRRPPRQRRPEATVGQRQHTRDDGPSRIGDVAAPLRVGDRLRARCSAEPTEEHRDAAGGEPCTAARHDDAGDIAYRRGNCTDRHGADQIGRKDVQWVVEDLGLDDRIRPRCGAFAFDFHGIRLHDDNAAGKWIFGFIILEDPG